MPRPGEDARIATAIGNETTAQPPGTEQDQTILSERHSTELVESCSTRAVVLDTNVVLDLLLYRDPGVRALAMAIEQASLRVVTDAACLAELTDVLSRDTLGAAPALRNAAQLAYLSMADPVTSTGQGRGLVLPQCRDPTDQKFMELALRSHARLLVTRDRALLELAKRIATLGVFEIVDPAGAALWLAEHAPGATP